MIDHAGLYVTDFARSKAFYQQALAPLNYSMLAEFPGAGANGADVGGFGEAPKPDFWIVSHPAQQPPIHIAIRAASRAMVDAFYKAALAAGGTDNGPPGIRAHYHPNYYGAFVRDPDGHNIEAVCHEPQ
ncbi:MAG: VOC family protein [Lysobacteraceae bacterium]|nr:MAG: VOC family protein [Xanthomonadaceae bacterium]